MAWAVFTHGSTWIVLKSEKPKPFHWLQGSLVTFPMQVSEAGKPISRWSKTKSSSPHIIHHYSSSSSKANVLQYYQPNCTNGEAQEASNPQPFRLQDRASAEMRCPEVQRRAGTIGLAASDFAVVCKTLTQLDIQEPLSLHSHHPPSGFLLPEKSHWSLKNKTKQNTRLWTQLWVSQKMSTKNKV